MQRSEDGLLFLERKLAPLLYVLMLLCVDASASRRGERVARTLE